jgi:hypothetical protein
MPPSTANYQEAKQRLNHHGQRYLTSTQNMWNLACEHRMRGDYMSGYLCLWVVFNNLYSWLAAFSENGERTRIEAAIHSLLPNAAARILGDDDYHERIRRLNQRQTNEEPTLHGIIDMQKYFRGAPQAEFLQQAKVTTGTDTEKLVSVATVLLYTVRNNLFHAIKDPMGEVPIVEDAYHLLEPIVGALLGVALERAVGR